MGKRVIVIGCPGSGKTTFSKRLKQIWNLPLYHLDSIYHLEDHTVLDKEEFDKRLLNILEKKEWIIDGNYQRTLKKRMEYCDAIFLFDLPVEECLKGIAERKGKKRDDLPWIEEDDPEFIESVKCFPKEKLPQIYELLKGCGKGKEITVFKSREEAERWLEDERRKDHPSDRSGL